MSDETVTVGILSDTHGYLDSRIADIVNRCDYAIHAGDICGAHVLDQIRPRKRLIAIAGNNDTQILWDASEAAVVSNLPARDRLDLPGGSIMIEHGHRLGNFPDHDQLRWEHADARVIVYGHTHKRIIDQSSDPWVINPGAAGKVRTKGGPSCLVLTASAADWCIEARVFEDAVVA
jgi:putative phosphoesterase